MREFLVAALLTIAGLVASPAEGSETYADDERQLAFFIQNGLLDPGVPIERRKALAKQFEDAALHGRPAWLYAVGSLYRIGSDNESSPFPKDLDKAREYLSRSALRGIRSAMAKLVFLELDAGNRFEANVWAQLNSYYEGPAQGDIGKPSGRPSASVLALAQDGFPKDEVARLEERVAAIITAYDASIRQGIERHVEALARNPLRNARGATCHPSEAQYASGRVRGKSLAAGGAEYFLAFAPDGSVDKFWLLDVWPNVRLERTLRVCVATYRVTPQEALIGKEFVAILPIVVVDPRLRLQQAKD